MDECCSIFDSRITMVENKKNYYFLLFSFIYRTLKEGNRSKTKVFRHEQKLFGIEEKKNIDREEGGEEDKEEEEKVEE